MKKIITGCLGCWLGLATSVNGSTGKHIELRSGVCLPQEKSNVHYKNAPCFSAECGLSWESWRLGLQIGYVKYENKKVTQGNVHANTVFGSSHFKDPRFKALSAMINLYHVWQLSQNVEFYVGGGLGMARLNYRFLDSRDDLNGGPNKVYKQDKNLLAAQVMCGVAYDLNDHWSVSLGYRCMKMETVKYNTIEDAEYWPSLKTPFLHSLEAGLRYKF